MPEGGIMLNCLAVGLGGMIGSILRYGISCLDIREAWLFPVRTFAVNMLGCLLIGLISAWAEDSARIDPKLLLFLKAGLCGGFTTFSTFSLETYALMNSGHTATAFGYVAASVMLGTALVFLGRCAV